MLMVISPAKTLDYQTPPATARFTLPQYLDHSQELIGQLRELSPQQIGELMHLSDKLSGLNAARFGSWTPAFTPENAKQALLAFKGDVYTGLNAVDFNEADFDYAQTHLRMLSGLYGLRVRTRTAVEVTGGLNEGDTVTVAAGAAIRQNSNGMRPMTPRF